MNSIGPLPAMVEDIRETLADGGRIFLSGCGATGRLALSLETFARESWLDPALSERIISFMAGGDAALIRSIESFEDYPAYGARQLRELGFSEKDLLIAITEGGETPWVIGTCHAAVETGSRQPWFLFCNPPEMLSSLLDRCSQILDSGMVKPFHLDIGPMALAGSTRLQATTAQMLVAGAALSEALGKESAIREITGFRDKLNALDYSFLAPYIEAEATIYSMGHHVLYRTDFYGITVLTDTTERSPTFSLEPFENSLRRSDRPCWCYLSLQGTDSPQTAWRTLLGRNPRTLEWPELADIASGKILLGYNISGSCGDWRHERIPSGRQYPYLVEGRGPTIEFAGHLHDLQMGDASVLLRHLVLKCVLNTQSTLVMGRLGLFVSNLMTRVKPSNFKLIDRAARHQQHFHRQKTGQELPYEDAVYRVFDSLK